MSQTQIHWTTSDLDLLPEDGCRYEIVDGELFVSRAPRWSHQEVCGRIFRELDRWSSVTCLGRASINPGILFSEVDNVIPDVVWASQARLDQFLDEAEHLTGAPELIVEVLSPGPGNERRDKQVKLKLYSREGVQEYWIVDPIVQQVQVYRRQQATLQLVATFFSSDQLTSPLLSGFSCPISHFFS